MNMHKENHRLAHAVLFIMYFFDRTNTEVVADEGHTVFLTVSRSNGLESAVSVEWETQPDTAVASGETTNSFHFKITTS